MCEQIDSSSGGQTVNNKLNISVDKTMNLSEHSVHKNSNALSKKLFKCSECDFVAGGSATLSYHMKMDHKQLRQFQCTECDYATFDSENLKAHLHRIHKRMAPYKCLALDFTANGSEKTSRKRRRPNFCDEEIFAMLSVVRDNKILLLGKLDNINTAKRKSRGWEHVTAAVNDVSSYKRDAFEIRKKFSDLRALVKKKVTSEIRQASETGNHFILKIFYFKN